MKYVLYIGRWQPFHNGHKYIIDKALENGENVLIAIRETPISESDPYTIEERKDMITQTYFTQVAIKRVKVISIPDIEAISIGRKVGYEIRELATEVPEEIKGISATKIRQLRDNNDPSWKDYVPKGTVNTLDKIKEDEGYVIWLTGLSGSGKSTIAKALARHIKNKEVKILDGDEVRENLTADLKFSKEDRDENIKRISYVAKCIADVGGVAIVAAISPYAEARNKARELITSKKFLGVFVDAPLSECEKRDVKGLYAKARKGEIKGFTGIDDPYEKPKDYLVVDTQYQTVDTSWYKIIHHIHQKMDASVLKPKEKRDK